MLFEQAFLDVLQILVDWIGFIEFLFLLGLLIQLSGVFVDLSHESVQRILPLLRILLVDVGYIVGFVHLVEVLFLVKVLVNPLV